MARILIVGGEEPLGPSAVPRALELAQRLIGEGHAVRLLGDAPALQRASGTLARDSAQPQQAGAFAAIEICAGDPLRLASAHRALERVSVAFWLLGCAAGPQQDLEALHDERLEAFLGRLVDSSARGLIYEAAGSVPAGMLAQGSELAAAIAARNALGFVNLNVDPAEREPWLMRACAGVREVLAG